MMQVVKVKITDKGEKVVPKEALIKKIKKHPTKFIMGNESFIFEIIKHKKRKTDNKYEPPYNIEYKTWMIYYHPRKRTLNVIETPEITKTEMYRVRHHDAKDILKILNKYPDDKRYLPKKTRNKAHKKRKNKKTHTKKGKKRK